jgi:hypothetical protein
MLPVDIGLEYLLALENSASTAQANGLHLCETSMSPLHESEHETPACDRGETPLYATGSTLALPIEYVKPTGATAQMARPASFRGKHAP